MFLPEKMMQIQAVFGRRDAEAVAEAVIREGSLQIVDAGDVEPWAQALDKYGAEEETEPMRARRERVEGMLKDLSVNRHVEGLHPADEPWDALDQTLAKLGQELGALKSEKESELKELNRLQNLRSKLGGLPTLGFPIEGRDAYSYLTVETGRVSDRHLDLVQEKLQPILHLFMPLGGAKGKTTVLVVALKRDRERLAAALAESGFETIELGKGEFAMPPEELAALDVRIQKVCEKIQALDDKAWEFGRAHGLLLRRVLFRIRKERLSHHLLRFLRKTDHALLLSGWVPKTNAAAFMDEVRAATAGRCVVTDTPAESVDSVRQGKVQVPVRLKNPAPVRPFELLTRAYGTPSYRSFDPTPLVGLSFLLMFGVMFGDVGHGLVLAIVGALLLWKLKGEARQAGLLILYAGCSSIVFGFLFGSIFGYEETLPTLWLKPMESISQLFKTLIFFGTGMLTVSVLLNVANKLKKGQWPLAVFNRSGLMGLVFYWSGIAMAIRILSPAAGTPSGAARAVPLLLAAAAVMLFLQEPITRLLMGKKKLFHEGAVTGLMEAAMEMLETFLGFLANTVSFIRVAAFGLAHVGLFMAVFSLAEGAQQVAHGAVSIVIQIIGNIGIVMLEGLVVTIQSVRLEFYEFFTRFFEHGDNPYRPVRSDLQSFT